MKKFLAWICLISVLFSSGALTAAATLFDGAQYGNTADDNMQFTFAVANDIVYLFAYGSVDGEMKYGYSRIDAPYDASCDVYQYALPQAADTGYGSLNYYSDGEKIWTLGREEDYCRLYNVSFSDTGEAEYALESEVPLYAEIEDEEIDPAWRRFMIYGDYFIGLTMSDSFELLLVTYDMEYDEAEIYDFDDEYRAINVLGVTPYTDETLLVASSPAMENTGEVVFYELDMAEGELTELMALPMGGYSSSSFGYVYDRANGLLYFMMEGVLYRLSALNPDSLEAIYDLGYYYTGSNIMAACHAAAITGDGHYIVSNGETLLACDISGEGESATGEASIKILGAEQEYGLNAAAAYVQAAPGSEVRFFNPSETEFDLTGALVSKSDVYDIYILTVDSSEYASMYDRGYLLPIENWEVTNFVEGIYPNLREAAVKDGSVVALPLSITCSVIAYDPDVLAALGYTTEDLPVTWRGYLEFLHGLPARLEGTDYTAFPADSWVSQVRGQILRHIVNAACAEMQNGVQTFDTPTMAEIIELFEAVDFEAMGLSPSRDDAQEMNEGMYLFTYAGSFEVKQGSDRMIPLPLSLDDDGEPTAPAEMTVAVINPYSQNRQAAEAFLADLIRFLPDESRANLRADWTGGVKMEGADENLAGADAEIEMLQAEIENANDDESRAAYELQLDEALAARERVLEKFYWLIPEDAVALYQAAEKYVQPMRYMGLDIEDDINPMMQKYLDGALDGGRFISDMDGKLRMHIQEME